MERHPDPKSPSQQVLDRFPDATGVLLDRYRSDRTVRALCHDLDLAFASLARFQSRPDASVRAEIADYSQMIVELEDELRQHLGLQKQK